jgi:hypothetical protein
VADVPAHEFFGGGPVTGLDEVEQFVVFLCRVGQEVTFAEGLEPV